MVTYIIQQGDTLYKIANQYGVSVQDVITANPGVNPFNLHVGQIIRVPTGTTNNQQYIYQGQQPAQQPMQQPMQQVPQLPQQIIQQTPQSPSCPNGSQSCPLGNIT
ncbi:LysM peptidoglycan-binding domain-containing protein [Oscillibacter sp.]|uniref:LysM peptidoglycan-binding domain-containing protein n=1 Tax=Oscillibacter sp. TaxID=1945593 RepID=UPI0033952E1B